VEKKTYSRNVRGKYREGEGTFENRKRKRLSPLRAERKNTSPKEIATGDPRINRQLGRRGKETSPPPGERAYLEKQGKAPRPKARRRVPRLRPPSQRPAQSSTVRERGAAWPLISKAVVTTGVTQRPVKMERGKSCSSGHKCPTSEGEGEPDPRAAMITPAGKSRPRKMKKKGDQSTSDSRSTRRHLLILTAFQDVDRKESTKKKGEKKKKFPRGHPTKDSCKRSNSRRY